jgi:hypothetical protein
MAVVNPVGPQMQTRVFLFCGELKPVELSVGRAGRCVLISVSLIRPLRPSQDWLASERTCTVSNLQVEKNRRKGDNDYSVNGIY